MQKYLLLGIICLIAVGVRAQNWSDRASCQAYFDKQETLNPIEGIWSMSYRTELQNFRGKLIAEEDHPHVAQLVIVSEANGMYGIYNLEGKPDYFDLIFESTAMPGQYLFTCQYPDSKTKASATAVFGEDGSLIFDYEKPEGQLEFELGRSFVNGMKALFEHQWVKMYPARKDLQVEAEMQLSEVENRSVLARSTVFILSKNWAITSLPDWQDEWGETCDLELRSDKEESGVLKAKSHYYDATTGLLLLNLLPIEKSKGEILYPLSDRFPFHDEELKLSVLNDGNQNSEFRNTHWISESALKDNFDCFAVKGAGKCEEGAALFDAEGRLMGLTTCPAVSELEDEQVKVISSLRMIQLLSRIDVKRSYESRETGEEFETEVAKRSKIFEVLR